MGLIKRLPEDVVNRIAAGEVVVRPANAVKELLENSLDAGSTEIVVTVRQGGLELLQVLDNGKGIAKDDLVIVCERFTTSKLEKFEDLRNMGTYGFRGEALASISYVAKVTITSKTEEQMCAYQGEYIDGVQKSIRASAGLKGTCISVKDLFYNCETRLRAFRNYQEEAMRIAETVTSYAIFRPDISFAFRRGNNIGDFRTSGDGKRGNVIASLLGPHAAKDLVEFDYKSTMYLFDLKGCFSKPESAVTSKSVQARKDRKREFLIFINGRLVQCGRLRHAVKSVFTDNDLDFVFCFLSMEIEASRIDVNVNPTKERVIFLEEESIVEEIKTFIASLVQQYVEAPLKCEQSMDLTNSQIERIPSSTQQKLFQNFDENESNDSPNTSLQSESSFTEKKLAPKKIVRTDYREQKLHGFFLPEAQKENVAGSQVEMVQVASQDSDVSLQTENGLTKRVFEFDSLQSLRKNICQEADMTLRPIFKSLIFVGFVNPEIILTQHSTFLYQLNLRQISEELFYQMILFSFGNFGSYSLAEDGISVELLYSLSESAPKTPETAENAKIAASFLQEQMELLEDYFSLSFRMIPDENDQYHLHLVGIPSIIDGFVPQLEGLASLIYDLTHNTDWSTEIGCFDGIARSLASFFTVKTRFCSEDKLSGLDNSTQWRRAIEFLILPKIKSKLIAQRMFNAEDRIQKVTDKSILYKVFERCQ